MLIKKNASDSVFSVASVRCIDTNDGIQYMGGKRGGIYFTGVGGDTEVNL